MSLAEPKKMRSEQMGVYQRGNTWFVDYYTGYGNNKKRVREAVGPRKKDAEAYLGKIKAAKRKTVFLI